MRRNWVGCEIVTNPIFLYNFIGKGVKNVYDNDDLLLLLDDDLFPIEEEENDDEI